EKLQVDFLDHASLTMQSFFQKMLL
ncbi:hypothetical protein DBR06_SOUSAS810125, partial [Sousa chinensis]